MSDEDNAAFTKILREKISPIEFLDADARLKKLRRLDSLVDKTAWNIFVTSPTPGEASFEELQEALERSDETLIEPFKSLLPRRHILYHPIRGIRSSLTRPEEEGGVRVETFNEAVFHFSYDRNDRIAHAFVEKFLRLLNKFLVHQFAAVNAETGELLSETRSGSPFWAGPHVIESCRQNPRRYICYLGRGKNGEVRCLAPLPLEAHGRE
jgi:hypothetical protein